MGKRNEYFSKFGISTITFTDEELKDVDSCFSVIAKYLSERGVEKKNLSNSISNINGLFDELSL
nr:type IIA topoisomerase, A subunit [Vibrio vulnificus]